MPQDIAGTIAAHLGVRDAQVRAAISLLDGGASVPFIARYRKEVTGALDDTQLRTLEERLRYLRELEERRAAILTSIDEQGKLTDQLRQAIMEADTKSRLEDLYLPYKPKRRTKAQIARENGLEPLAELLLTHPDNEPLAAASGYVTATVPDAAAALDGARAILVERLGEDGDLIGDLRERLWTHGELTSHVKEGKEDAGAKYADYFNYREPLHKLPSHRTLALFRAEKEEILTLAFDPDPDASLDTDSGAPGRGPEPGPYEQAIAERFGIRAAGRAADPWLLETVRRAWRGRISLGLEVDLRMRLREAAEQGATQVFAANLRSLLLAAPAGARTTMGLDPGYRTGVKVAVVDASGKVVDTAVIYPHKPQGKWREAVASLAALIREHQVELISIGNGTASRETDKLAAEVVAANPGVTKVVVSEAGASVYSASAYAAAELPTLDVTLRGAVSIARRLQDPLAELVKIEPKSIGVGQYQHDLPERELTRALDAVVEDCVNAVGVELNTASAPLLARVSGIGPALAGSIVEYRESGGPLRSRDELMRVPRLGAKAFEQAAGFLRIHGGANPLDASAVHPEAYTLVHTIAERAGVPVPNLIGNTQALRAINPHDFVTERFGLPTVTDVLTELDKPGRDPRPTFVTARFAPDVHEVGDLNPGMILEGQVTNVAAFGAFVDVGVHQDGLVHVSAMSDRFVKDPREVVSPGDVVKVKVLDVDVARGRISLSMRLTDEVAPPGSRGRSQRRQTVASIGNPTASPTGSSTAAPTGAMADALRRAGYTGAQGRKARNEQQ